MPVLNPFAKSEEEAAIHQPIQQNGEAEISASPLLALYLQRMQFLVGWLSRHEIKNPLIFDERRAPP